MGSSLLLQGHPRKPEAKKQSEVSETKWKQEIGNAILNYRPIWI